MCPGHAPSPQQHAIIIESCEIVDIYYYKFG